MLTHRRWLRKSPIQVILNSRIHLCRFHSMRAFQDKIKTMGWTVENRDGVTELVRKLVNAKKEFLFEEYKKVCLFVGLV